MQAAERVNDYLEMLNPAQRQAAEYGALNSQKSFCAGPLLVIAGAGTGNERQVLFRERRVAYLLEVVLHRAEDPRRHLVRCSNCCPPKTKMRSDQTTQQEP